MRITVDLGRLWALGPTPMDTQLQPIVELCAISNPTPCTTLWNCPPNCKIEATA
jgi:hypothetical protein